MLGHGIKQDYFVAIVAASCLFRSSISLNRAWTSTEQVTGRAVVGCNVGRDIGDRVELAGRAMLSQDVGQIVVGFDVVEDEGPHVAPGNTW